MDLELLGWNPFFEAHWAQMTFDSARPARVVAQHKHLYHVVCAEGEYPARVTGRMLHEASGPADLPAVGDWVAAKLPDRSGEAAIQAILPRRSGFSRSVVESTRRTEEQILAANVDIAFLISGLDHEFKLRRVERYLTAACDSGATPVIILNKADLHRSAEDFVEKVAGSAPGVPIHLISAATGAGFEAFDRYLLPGKTVVLLGSSGVGKSSIINRLLGENRIKTESVRDSDSRGRHTTTHRELLVLPGGALIIDTPGMRELVPFVDEDGVGRAFEDIEELEQQCRFSDCHHRGEPGCAIAEALESGALDLKRWRNYQSLQSQAARLSRRRKELERRQADKEFSQRIEKYRRQYRKLNRDGHLGRKWE